MSASSAEVAHAAAVLREGGLVAFPTETVYGLGADASSEAAVRRLYEVKGRPAGHPVIVHLAGAGALDDWVTGMSDAARALADACWPGPLTLVLRRATRVPDAVTGGLDTVGVRVPDQALALELLRVFDGGIAAPSANRFGRVSPTTADDVRADLGSDVDVVLDGGACRVGVESTIVDCSGGDVTILRVGGVPSERIEAELGHAVAVRDDRSDATTPRAPGTLPAHYAPHARVEVVRADEIADRVAAARGRGERAGVIVPAPAGTAAPGGAVVLGAPKDGDAYARSLYRWFRDADAQGLDVVLAVAPQPVGIGAAVADRLTRAARAADPEASATDWAT